MSAHIGRKGARRGGIAGLAILMALAGRPITARAAEDIVKLGDLLALSNVGVYIAIEKGYFREHGIRNDITTFASAGKAVPALAAGELDVAVGTASAGLFNSIEQGAGFRIVADKGQSRPGHGYVLLAVRKDLVDSGQVKSVKDLRGKKVALFAQGIIQSYLMGKMAEAAGLTIRDFDLTYLSAPNQVTAFETKAIAAAQTVEPWGARFEDRKVAVRFLTPDKVKGLGPVQIAAIIYSGNFITEHRDVAQRWMDAYLKGCQLYVEKGLHDPEIASILAKYTKVSPEDIQQAIPSYQDPHGKLNLENLQDQINWFVANGYMKRPIDVQKVVDLSFLR